MWKEGECGYYSNMKNYLNYVFNVVGSFMASKVVRVGRSRTFMPGVGIFSIALIGHLIEKRGVGRQEMR